MCEYISVRIGAGVIFLSGQVHVLLLIPVKTGACVSIFASGQVHALFYFYQDRCMCCF